MLHGIDRDTTAWHLLQAWLEGHASRCPNVTVSRGTEVITATPGDAHRTATAVTAGGTDTYPVASGPQPPIWPTLGA